MLNRPLGVPAVALAGLEMRRVPARERAGPCRTAPRWRRATGSTPGRTACLVRGRAADPTPLADPLTADQAARSADGCVVIVLAAETARADAAAWVDGVGWNQDAPSIESRGLGSRGRPPNARHPRPTPRRG